MDRFAPKSLVLGLIVAGYLGLYAAPARAADPDKKVAESFGIAVMGCIRPSTLLAKEKPFLTDYKVATGKAGRLDLTVEMRFYGYWTSNPYDAKFTIKLDTSGTPEILGIDYTDDCLVPAPDVRLLNALIRKLNEEFKKGK